MAYTKNICKHLELLYANNASPLLTVQSHPAADLRIVLVGGRYGRIPSGESSAGNIILDQNVFDASRRTAQSEARQQEVFGRRVTVVDTPGWWWLWPKEDTPKLDQIEIQNSVHLCPPGPHVFLLLIPISLHLSQRILKPLTERVWRHCMVLFTWGHWLNDLPVENYIVREGKELQELLEKCGNRYHVLNPKHSDDLVQLKELFQKMFVMVKQNKVWFTTKHNKREYEWNKREQNLIEKILKRKALPGRDNTWVLYQVIRDPKHGNQTGSHAAGKTTSNPVHVTQTALTWWEYTELRINI
uniref:Uncharacterized LOC102233465 n=1 Tax=Xiphophorus maculatus TaxID=8083 RepID=A0A3B5QTQ4_XIPMA